MLISKEVYSPLNVGVWSSRESPCTEDIPRKAEYSCYVPAPSTLAKYKYSDIWFF